MTCRNSVPKINNPGAIAAKSGSATVARSERRLAAMGRGPCPANCGCPRGGFTDCYPGMAAVAS